MNSYGMYMYMTVTDPPAWFGQNKRKRKGCNHSPFLPFPKTRRLAAGRKPMGNLGHGSTRVAQSDSDGGLPRAHGVLLKPAVVPFMPRMFLG